MNAKDNSGRTALHYAAENGDETIVRLLVEHEADKTIQDKRGMTALMLATTKGHNTMVNLLLDYSAKADGQDSQPDNIDIPETMQLETANDDLESLISIESEGRSMISGDSGYYSSGVGSGMTSDILSAAVKYIASILGDHVQLSISLCSAYRTLDE
ncbi:ankyrin, partial [Wilcoxina mikolae CBS 423.85]